MKFEEEFEECENYWEDKLNEYGESLKRLEEEIRTNQEKELKDYQDSLETKKPKLDR